MSSPLGKVTRTKAELLRSLHTAAASNDCAKIQALADEEGMDFDMQNKRGDTAMIIAARHGHVDVIRKLADLGASLSMPDETGSTPIYIAASNRHVDAILILVSLGASPSVP